MEVAMQQLKEDYLKMEARRNSATEDLAKVESLYRAERARNSELMLTIKVLREEKESLTTALQTCISR